MNSLRKAKFPSLPFSSPSSSSSNCNSPDSPPPPIDQSIKDDLQSRHQSLSRLFSAFTLYHTQQSKLKLNPTPSIKFDKEKNLPLYWVGQEFISTAEAHSASTSGVVEVGTYGAALETIGQTHLQLTSITTSFLDSLGTTFLPALSLQLDKFLDFEKSYKEAEKVRSSLNGVLQKVQKAKKEKEKQDAEDELESVSRDYEDLCDSLKRKATALDNGTAKDLDKLKELLEIQLEFADKYSSALSDCHASLHSYTAPPSSPYSSTSPSSRPPITPKQSHLILPLAQTRMSRSHSDSSAMQQTSSTNRRPPPIPSPTFFSGRNRSDSKSSVGDSGNKKEKEKEKESRSRSGSILGRFTGGAGGSGRNSPAPSYKKKNGEEDGENDEEDDEGDKDSYSGSQPTVTTSSLTIPSFRNPLSKPSLPSLNLMKRSGGGGKYDTLDETTSLRPSPPRRTQSSSPSSPPPISTSFQPQGKLYKAAWDYTSTSLDELGFKKGDVIKIEKEVNGDWWIGSLVNAGERGMFPRGFVVPFELGEEDGRAIGRNTSGGGVGSRWKSSTNPSSEEEGEEESEEEEEDRKKKAASLASQAMSRLGSSGNGSVKRVAPPPPPSRRRITVSGGESPFAD